MDNKILTSHQLYTFAGLSLLGGSLLVISSSITAAAQHDAWISALAVMLPGVLTMCLYGYLGTRYLGFTLIGLSRKIFGKWVGNAVAGCYVFFLFTLSYGTAWWTGSFGAHYMHETPVPVILFLYAVAIVIAVYYGIEAIGRMSELAFLYVTVMFLLSILLVLPNVRKEYLTPVFEFGAIPILKGTFLLGPINVFIGVALLMIFPSSIGDIREGRKALVKGGLWCNLVVFITIFMSIAVLGANIVARSTFPTLLLAREISIGPVLTRFEYIISSMWTVTEFMVGLYTFYAFVKALSEFVGLKDHKRIVAPLGLIVMLLGWLIHPDAEEQLNWVITGFTPNTAFFGFVLPVIMLVVYLIKKWLLKKV